ncbi:unnamed protein product [Mytilus coruscus]|uniref:Peptidase A2 domain-containing protein n=1 Tax=Mytilus coruscus TaxID=42192 RepID=A0A6J8ATC0_MYTCO|nr:unnamed protein product [Mytilus coruscus]
MLNVKILSCNNKGGNEDLNTNPVIDKCIDNSFEIFDTDLDTAMVDVVIDRVRSVTLRAPLRIESEKVKAVVDTGAEVTVMSESLFFKTPEAKRPSLQVAKRNLVVAEAGCDVIDEKDVTINTKRGLEIQGVWIDCDVQRRLDNVARILLKETVTIPPNSEVILEGHGVNYETIDTRYGSIEPVIEDETKILVARCLVDPFQDNIPDRLVNLDSSPVKIRKNYLLGEIHPVVKYDNFVHEDRHSSNISSSTEGISNWVEIGKGISQGDLIEPPNIRDDLKCLKVSSVDTINSGVQADTPKLPDHLKDLYEKSCVKLSNSKDKIKLAEVLIKNQNTFAKNKTDLDGKHPLCPHQKDGQYKEDCSTCQSIVNDWSEFNCTVDNVGNLSQNTFSCGVRVVTRSQNKKLMQSNWLDGYTTKEIETFQREDNDLKFIHQWTDNNILPKRDEAMANSPSVRKYWLNFNLLHKEHGVLYQKRLLPNDGISYQLPST